MLFFLVLLCFFKPLGVETLKLGRQGPPIDTRELARSSDVDKLKAQFIRPTPGDSTSN